VAWRTESVAHRSSAIGFCRLSTEEQAQEGRAGLLRQHQEIRLSAERWNLEVVRTVEITDVSGTQVLESQEVQELLRSLPDVDGVVVAAIDRLMRPDDFSSFSIYDHFLKQRKLLWTPSSRLDVHEDREGIHIRGYWADAIVAEPVHIVIRAATLGTNYGSDIGFTRLPDATYRVHVNDMDRE
jgi:hypothetical protein